MKIDLAHPDPMLGRLLSSLITGRNTAASKPLRRAADARARGDWREAVAALREALRKSPGDAQAHNDLGVAYAEIGEFSAARESFSRALDFRADLVAARVNLGHLEFQGVGRFREAAAHYRAALEIDPALHETRCQYGLALYELGEVEAAIRCFETVLQESPSHPLASEYSLFVTHALQGRSEREHFQDHRLWGARYKKLNAGRHSRPGISLSVPRACGRLRIGYVSADFREHATARFALPALEAYDRNGFEVYCYANQPSGDPLTSKMMRCVAAWRNIFALQDDEAAALIRSDRIDVLVDLSGHTRGNRLGIFGQRPAPIQATWLGYLNTTGMDAIGWRITDAASDPPGLADACHCERLLRLQPSSWCFRAPEEAPEPSPGPLAALGYATFGSFNHVAKLNAQVLALWVELLVRCPKTRLKLLAVPDDMAAARLARPFLDRGIALERLEFLPRLPRAQYFQALAGVDIALDPFPYSGGATTCDALWMGVPVVALAGSFGFARTAAAMLSLAGLDELVAETPDVYLEHAVRLAADPGRLESLRSSLRSRLLASPLMDERGFIRQLEAAYRGLAASAQEAFRC